MTCNVLPETTAAPQPRACIACSGPLQATEGDVCKACSDELFQSFQQAAWQQFLEDEEQIAICSGGVYQ